MYTYCTGKTHYLMFHDTIGITSSLFYNSNRPKFQSEHPRYPKIQKHMVQDFLNINR